MVLHSKQWTVTIKSTSHHLRRLESTAKLVEEGGIGLSIFVGNGKIERLDVFIARTGHHGKGHGRGFDGNGEGHAGNINTRHLDTIADGLEEVELGNSLVGIELVLGDLSSEDTSLGIGIVAEGEARGATNDHIAIVAVEAIALLALEEHVKSRPRTGGAGAGSDAQESTFVPTLEVEEVKVNGSDGASEQKRRGERREVLHG